mmetsp:Transcript_7577/g.18412  ORF Transcript_7577/g.18412 Transcript_7577/m.18412 type:complete len:229 (+) Transcript_7577:445-1131(+)
MSRAGPAWGSGSASRMGGGAMAETLLPGEGKHRKVVRAAGSCPEIGGAGRSPSCEPALCGGAVLQLEGKEVLLLQVRRAGARCDTGAPFFVVALDSLPGGIQPETQLRLRAPLSSRGCVEERSGSAAGEGRRCCFFKWGGQAHAPTQPGAARRAVLQLEGEEVLCAERRCFFKWGGQAPTTLVQSQRGHIWCSCHGFQQRDRGEVRQTRPTELGALMGGLGCGLDGVR